MRKVLTPKVITILACLLTLIGISINGTSEDTERIAGLILAIWLAITIHELGHIIFGKIAGFEFVFFTTGPIQVKKTPSGIKLKENKSWGSVGGIAMMTPPLVKRKEMIKKQIFYSAGGPFLSLFFSLVSIILYSAIDHTLLLLFFLINGGIFVVTLIPTGKGDAGSDGYFVITLLRNNKKSLELIENTLISGELLSSKKPKEWHTEYIKLAKQKTPKINNVMYGMLLYYFEIEDDGFHSAKRKVDGYTAIPITKDNSSLLSVFIHMQQLDVFLAGEKANRFEKINNLQQFLTPIEPVSFYRGRALLDFLQNNRSQAIKNIEKVKNIINKNEEKYGFFKAEKTLTKMVEEIIV